MSDFNKTLKRSDSAYGTMNLENLPVGFVIDERYEIKSKLGQGGFGAVYLTYDRKLEIDKAIKVIPEAVTNDVEAMTDLKAEARIMLKLNHPNIVRVYDLHDTGDVKYIDMKVRHNWDKMPHCHQFEYHISYKTARHSSFSYTISCTNYLSF